MNKNFLTDFFALEKKVVFITGSNGQLGNSICKTFNETGTIVLGADLGNTTNHDFLDDYYPIDISKKENVQDIFKKSFAKYKNIDILINNAGVSTFEPFEERPEDKFNWVVDVNLKGTFNCIQSYVKYFDEFSCTKGTIINIASMYGIISPDFRIYTDCDRKNSEVYGATKAGIIQMTKYFAVHLADRNIRVNSISPGGIFNQANPQGEDFIKNYSQRCPMKRMAKDSEMVGAILYLASEASSYTTGANIIIDGGMSCW